jgi:hypothetical protein
MIILLIFLKICKKKILKIIFKIKKNRKLRFMNDGPTELCFISARYEEDVEIN